MATEQYPSNSQTSRTRKPEESQERPKIEKMIEGEAVKRKRPWHKRVVAAFIGEDDAKGMVNYVVEDMVIPAVKDLIFDTASTMVERVLFGDDVRPRRRGGRGLINTQRTDYNGISRTAPRRDEPRREMSARGRQNFELYEIHIPTRHEADNVLALMFETLDRYDLVTVADLYNAVGVSTEHTDVKWGWEGPGALAGARAVRIKGEYLLDLPAPEYIK